MVDAAQSGAVPDGVQRSKGRSPRPHDEPGSLLNTRRPFKAAIPDSSVGSVRKVAKLDAGTHIIAARKPGGSWYRLTSRTRFTRENARLLREAGIYEVVLRRRTRRASFPLGWLSNRSD